MLLVRRSVDNYEKLLLSTINLETYNKLRNYRPTAVEEEDQWNPDDWSDITEENIQKVVETNRVVFWDYLRDNAVGGLFKKEEAALYEREDFLTLGVGGQLSAIAGSLAGFTIDLGLIGLAETWTLGALPALETASPRMVLQGKKAGQMINWFLQGGKKYLSKGKGLKFDEAGKYSKITKKYLPFNKDLDAQEILFKSGFLNIKGQNGRTIRFSEFKKMLQKNAKQSNRIKTEVRDIQGRKAVQVVNKGKKRGTDITDGGEAIQITTGPLLRIWGLGVQDAKRQGISDAIQAGRWGIRDNEGGFVKTAEDITAEDMITVGALGMANFMPKDAFDIGQLPLLRGFSTAMYASGGHQIVKSLASPHFLGLKKWTGIPMKGPRAILGEAAFFGALEASGAHSPEEAKAKGAAGAILGALMGARGLRSANIGTWLGKNAEAKQVLSAKEWQRESYKGLEQTKVTDRGFVSVTKDGMIKVKDEFGEIIQDAEGEIGLRLEKKRILEKVERGEKLSKEEKGKKKIFEDMESNESLTKTVFMDNGEKVQYEILVGRRSRLPGDTIHNKVLSDKALTINEILPKALTDTSKQQREAVKNVKTVIDTLIDENGTQELTYGKVYDALVRTFPELKSNKMVTRLLKGSRYRAGLSKGYTEKDKIDINQILLNIQDLRKGEPTLDGVRVHLHTGYKDGLAVVVSGGDMGKLLKGKLTRMGAKTIEHEGRTLYVLKREGKKNLLIDFREKLNEQEDLKNMDEIDFTHKNDIDRHKILQNIFRQSEEKVDAQVVVDTLTSDVFSKDVRIMKGESINDPSYKYDQRIEKEKQEAMFKQGTELGGEEAKVETKPIKTTGPKTIKRVRKADSLAQRIRKGTIKIEEASKPIVESIMKPLREKGEITVLGRKVKFSEEQYEWFEKSATTVTESLLKSGNKLAESVAEMPDVVAGIIMSGIEAQHKVVGRTVKEAMKRLKFGTEEEAQKKIKEGEKVGNWVENEYLKDGKDIREVVGGRNWIDREGRMVVQVIDKNAAVLQHEFMEGRMEQMVGEIRPVGANIVVLETLKAAYKNKFIRRNDTTNGKLVQLYGGKDVNEAYKRYTKTTDFTHDIATDWNRYMTMKVGDKKNWEKMKDTLDPGTIEIFEQSAKGYREKLKGINKHLLGGIPMFKKLIQQRGLKEDLKEVVDFWDAYLKVEEAKTIEDVDLGVSKLNLIGLLNNVKTQEVILPKSISREQASIKSKLQHDLKTIQDFERYKEENIIKQAQGLIGPVQTKTGEKIPYGFPTERTITTWKGPWSYGNTLRPEGDYLKYKDRTFRLKGKRIWWHKDAKVVDVLDESGKVIGKRIKGSALPDTMGDQQHWVDISKKGFRSHPHWKFLMESFKQGVEHKNWYFKSFDEYRAITFLSDNMNKSVGGKVLTKKNYKSIWDKLSTQEKSKYDDRAYLFLDLLSISSAQSQLPDNIIRAATIYRWLLDNPTAKEMKHTGVKKEDLPKGKELEKMFKQGIYDKTVNAYLKSGTIQSTKLAEFILNMRGDLDTATIDTHINQLFGARESAPSVLTSEGKFVPKAKAYREKIYAILEKMADDLGVTRSQVQAAIWVGNIKRTDPGRKGSHDFVDSLNKPQTLETEVAYIRDPSKKGHNNISQRAKPIDVLLEIFRQEKEFGTTLPELLKKNERPMTKKIISKGKMGEEQVVPSNNMYKNMFKKKNSPRTIIENAFKRIADSKGKMTWRHALGEELKKEKLTGVAWDTDIRGLRKNLKATEVTWDSEMVTALMDGTYGRAVEIADVFSRKGKFTAKDIREAAKQVILNYGGHLETGVPTYFKQTYSLSPTREFRKAFDLPPESKRYKGRHYYTEAFMRELTSSIGYRDVRMKFDKKLPTWFWKDLQELSRDPNLKEGQHGPKILRFIRELEKHEQFTQDPFIRRKINQVKAHWQYEEYNRLREKDGLSVMGLLEHFHRDNKKVGTRAKDIIHLQDELIMKLPMGRFFDLRTQTGEAKTEKNFMEYFGYRRIEESKASAEFPAFKMLLSQIQPTWFHAKERDFQGLDYTFRRNTVPKSKEAIEKGREQVKEYNKLRKEKNLPPVVGFEEGVTFWMYSYPSSVPAYGKRSVYKDLNRLMEPTRGITYDPVSGQATVRDAATRHFTDVTDFLTRRYDFLKDEKVAGGKENAFTLREKEKELDRIRNLLDPKKDTLGQKTKEELIDILEREMGNSPPQDKLHIQIKDGKRRILWERNNLTGCTVCSTTPDPTPELKGIPALKKRMVENLIDLIPVRWVREFIVEQTYGKMDEYRAGATEDFIDYSNTTLTGELRGNIAMEHLTPKFTVNGVYSKVMNGMVVAHREFSTPELKATGRLEKEVKESFRKRAKEEEGISEGEFSALWEQARDMADPRSSNYIYKFYDEAKGTMAKRMAMKGVPQEKIDAFLKKLDSEFGESYVNHHWTTDGTREGELQRRYIVQSIEAALELADQKPKRGTKLFEELTEKYNEALNSLETVIEGDKTKMDKIRDIISYQAGMGKKQAVVAKKRRLRNTDHDIRNIYNELAETVGKENLRVKFVEDVPHRAMLYWKHVAHSAQSYILYEGMNKLYIPKVRGEAFTDKNKVPIMVVQGDITKEKKALLIDNILTKYDESGKKISSNEKIETWNKESVASILGMMGDEYVQIKPETWGRGMGTIWVKKDMAPMFRRAFVPPSFASHRGYRQMLRVHSAVKRVIMYNPLIHGINLQVNALAVSALDQWKPKEIERLQEMLVKHGKDHGWSKQQIDDAGKVTFRDISAWGLMRQNFANASKRKDIGNLRKSATLDLQSPVYQFMIDKGFPLGVSREVQHSSLSNIIPKTFVGLNTSKVRDMFKGMETMGDDFLFHNISPATEAYIFYTTYRRLNRKLKDKFPDRKMREQFASRGAERITTTLSGKVSKMDMNENYEAIGNAMLFANHWTVSNFRTATGMLGLGTQFKNMTEGGKALQQEYINAVARWIGYSWLAGNMVNKAVTGHMTYDNEPDKRDRIAVAKEIYKGQPRYIYVDFNRFVNDTYFYLRPTGLRGGVLGYLMGRNPIEKLAYGYAGYKVGDVLSKTLGEKVANKYLGLPGEHDAIPEMKHLLNKMNPVPKAVFQMIANVDFFYKQEIAKEDDPTSKQLRDRLSFLTTELLPFNRDTFKPEELRAWSEGTTAEKIWKASGFFVSHGKTVRQFMFQFNILDLEFNREKRAILTDDRRYKTNALKRKALEKQIKLYQTKKQNLIDKYKDFMKGKAE